jgi:hypothetical protein
VPTPTDPWVVQRLLPGRQLCTWGLCHQGRLVAFCAYETRFTLGIGASASFEMLEHPGLEAWMARFVEGLGFTGQLGLDFIEAADGTPQGIEANPRITSGFHLFAHDPGVLERYWNADLPRLKPVGGRPAMLGVSIAAGAGESSRILSGCASGRRCGGGRARSCGACGIRCRCCGGSCGWPGWCCGASGRGRPPAEAIAVDMEWNGEP